MLTLLEAAARPGDVGKINLTAYLLEVLLCLLHADKTCDLSVDSFLGILVAKFLTDAEVDRQKLSRIALVLRGAVVAVFSIAIVMF